MMSNDALGLLPDVGAELVDAFSRGIDMVLRALKEEVVAGAGRPIRSTSVIARATGQITSQFDIASRRARLEAAAARFQNPVISTVICIKPASRVAAMA